MSCESNSRSPEQNFNSKTGGRPQQSAIAGVDGSVQSFGAALRLCQDRLHAGENLAQFADTVECILGGQVVGHDEPTLGRLESQLFDLRCIEVNR